MAGIEFTVSLAQGNGIYLRLMRVEYLAMVQNCIGLVYQAGVFLEADCRVKHCFLTVSDLELSKQRWNLFAEIKLPSRWRCSHYRDLRHQRSWVVWQNKSIVRIQSAGGENRDGNTMLAIIALISLISDVCLIISQLWCQRHDEVSAVWGVAGWDSGLKHHGKLTLHS